VRQGQRHGREQRQSEQDAKDGRREACGIHHPKGCQQVSPYRRESNVGRLRGTER